MNINIKHLYPSYLNLYGDKGNINTLKYRCLWRGIDVTVEEIENNNFSLHDCDILILGGGYEKEQSYVLGELSSKKEEIKNYIENNKVMVAFCGGFEMLGKSKGLGILDLETSFNKKRIMGDCITEVTLDNQSFTLTGFENHKGIVDIKNYSPLGTILKGNGESKQEGLVYKNLIATHLHGPLLPKNPVLADIIISRALKIKYPEFTKLDNLDDTWEEIAHKNIVLKYQK